MPNKAQEELEGLLAIQNEAEDSQANLAKLMDSQHDFIAGPGEEAEFAWPEATATAVAASWVLGPVGLLLGVAQGVLGKQEQQAALDEYAERSGVLETTSDIFNDQLERYALTATAPEDIEQLQTLQTLKDSAIQMMASASPVLQQQGMTMLSDFQTGLEEYGVRNEEQRILAEAADAEAKRVLGEQKYQQHRNLVGDFQRESGNFEAQQQAANNILEAVNKGDGASLTAALATLPLLVNPQAGATTDAEVDMWNGIGGTVDGLMGRLQKELGSGGMTDATRKEIIGVATQYKRNTLAYQQAREAYYGQAVLNEKIPEQYWSQYNYSSRLPVVQQGGFVRGEDIRSDKAESGDSVPGAALDTAGNVVTRFIDATSMKINDAIDGYKHQKAWREEFFRIHGQYPADDLGGRIK